MKEKGELVVGGGVSEPLRQQDTVHIFIYISTCLNIFCSVHLGSISNFKTELRNMKDISRVPKKYENGHRKLNIVLTKLRCSGSFMN
jgi:hypothetical protein